MITTIGAVAAGALALAVASAPAYADVASGHEQGQKAFLISTNTQAAVRGDSDSQSSASARDHQKRDGRGDHDGESHNNDHNDGDHSPGDDGNHSGNHNQWGHDGNEHGHHHDGQWNHHHWNGWNNHDWNGWNNYDWNHGGHNWYDDNQWSHKSGLYIKRDFSWNESRATRITGFQVTPGRAHEGDRLSLDGRLRSGASNGHHIGRQRIHVYFRSNGYGDWRNVDTLTTDSDGGFRTDVRARRSGTWLVKFNGNDSFRGAEARDYVKVVG
ncbi:hypothetical protein [Planotetraspora sp. GP83]|uniref:hypothetical protein n=1 Tax=Planotetraspora sp. GP83 TaxID=3156264 RepID=UPI00351859EA